MNCFLRILSGNERNHDASAAVIDFARLDFRSRRGDEVAEEFVWWDSMRGVLKWRRSARERFLETGGSRSLAVVIEPESCASLSRSKVEKY